MSCDCVSKPSNLEGRFPSRKVERMPTGAPTEDSAQAEPTQDGWWIKTERADPADAAP